jgi:hypothetical protein
MLFDPSAIFAAIKTGGPAVIFVLVFLLGMLLTGQLRAKANVDSETAAMERAHLAELAARDREIANLIRLSEQMQGKIDREHELFQAALTMIRADLMPLLRSSMSGGRR